MDLRVSIGTAIYTGLKDGRLSEAPTTAYLMIPGGVCRGGCTYCPQSSGDSRWLSRVSWPIFDIEDIKESIIRSDVRRVCLQSPDIPGYEKKIKKVVSELEKIGKPISISAPPLTDESLQDIKGPVDHIGVGIDGATDEIRRKTKPNYDPKIFWDYLGRALDIYGKNRVIAHVIAGMGEDLEELGFAVNRAIGAGAKVSLFPFQTLEKGKKNERDDELDADRRLKSNVSVRYYRKAQLMTYLLEIGEGLNDALEKLDEPACLLDTIKKGDIFKTQGCPGCNRPYYTSRPGEMHKNFPRSPTPDEIDSIIDQLNIDAQNTNNR